MLIEIPDESIDAIGKAWLLELYDLMVNYTDQIDEETLNAIRHLLVDSFCVTQQEGLDYRIKLANIDAGGKV